MPPSGEVEISDDTIQSGEESVTVTDATIQEDVAEKDSTTEILIGEESIVE